MLLLTKGGVVHCRRPMRSMLLNLWLSWGLIVSPLMALWGSPQTLQGHMNLRVNALYVMDCSLLHCCYRNLEGIFCIHSLVFLALFSDMSADGHLGLCGLFFSLPSLLHVPYPSPCNYSSEVGIAYVMLDSCVGACSSPTCALPTPHVGPSLSHGWYRPGFLT